jgi:hypothetical protein
VTMSVEYFTPKVTVKLCIIDFFLLEIIMVIIMNNLNVCSAHSYLYPQSRLKLVLWAQTSSLKCNDIVLH